MIGLLAAIIVSASIDSTQMVLGEQTKMQLEVTCNAAEGVQIPKPEQQLPTGVESLNQQPKTDTVTENGQLRLQQEWILTSFRDTVYTVQPFVLTASGDTVKAAPQTLTILRPEGIDQMMDIHDIKDIERAGIWWWNIVMWILIALGIGVFIGAIVYVVLWQQRHKQKETPLAQKIILRPAEEVALEQLDAIKAAKIWQQGHGKQYHTELTDVIRTYIGRRFDVHSTEKTSDETLRELKPILLSNQPSAVSIQNGKELYERLSKMLQLADFVKFAKYEAMPEENEKALDTAYEFVNATTPQKVEEEEKV